MSAHIIGRPQDDVLDILLGHGADPEQAFIGGSEQGLEEGDGFEDHLLGDEPSAGAVGLGTRQRRRLARQSFGFDEATGTSLGDPEP